jgi:hypothetical protein
VGQRKQSCGLTGSQRAKKGQSCDTPVLVPTCEMFHPLWAPPTQGTKFPTPEPLGLKPIQTIAVSKDTLRQAGKKDQLTWKQTTRNYTVGEKYKSNSKSMDHQQNCLIRIVIKKRNLYSHFLHGKQEMFPPFFSHVPPLINFTITLTTTKKEL